MKMLTKEDIKKSFRLASRMSLLFYWKRITWIESRRLIQNAYFNWSAKGYNYLPFVVIFLKNYPAPSWKWKRTLIFPSTPFWNVDKLRTVILLKHVSIMTSPFFLSFFLSFFLFQYCRTLTHFYSANISLHSLSPFNHFIKIFLTREE